uniref:Uncharacterized protein n=1 Tax=Candidatus Kentrum sp. LPFa TaxID=2126335 RepID=A0A450Y4Y8_9GAMM|nr:MAG: hypothetical protein BECKLPF1236A_GA0070988_106652 [Candidatus Kentron sp. LPFa]VFK28639.1 MAG: hypothetical protein BECKLPF1236A_GA0070988_106772 [Candidatus Kentron sp. LPFa]VFK36590.1 MAG: hypothetical protein BECKLPF1236C_GA0070990_106502 [Candidatus Kentron sp. LPFa]
MRHSLTLLPPPVYQFYFLNLPDNYPDTGGKTEIDCLDGRYLELVLNIIRQFPRAASDRPQAVNELETGKSKRAMDIAQEIADSGGLGIGDPVAWQREIRRDRTLPSRSE